MYASKSHLPLRLRIWVFLITSLYILIFFFFSGGKGGSEGFHFTHLELPFVSNRLEFSVYNYYASKEWDSFEFRLRLTNERYPMKSELEVAWQRLKLTEEEEEILISADEVPSEKAEQVALCLLGRLHTSNYFNPRALKTVLKNIWKTTNGVVMKELEKNLFAFQFFSRADKDFALEEGLWSFDGSLLLLKEMFGLEQPSKVDLLTTRLWVKAYDVPGLKQTPMFAKPLEDNVGSFAGCEETTLCGVDKSLNFKVDIDITKPLKRGIRTLVGGNPIWIRFKYVKLPDFYYAFGKLGHVYKECVLFDLTVSENDLQYGSWLRASLLNSRGKTVEADRLEEQRLVQAFRNKTVAGNIKKKVVADTAEGSKTAAQVKVSQMIIDVLILGGEVFKCKHDAKIENREVEKVRVVQNTSGEDSSTDAEAISAVINLRRLLRRLFPRVVFLSETKKSKVDMELILNRLGDFFGIFIDSGKRLGGLALLGDKSVDLQFLSSSFHHIDVTIQWSINESVWRFTGIYGWVEIQYKL
ncbi:LOW QUALITY PROTEIN: hypothetical protein Cgig2_019797 [Carnegiea gigantea]|uniref:DUF4283 domain-containing protein n=1 Tax=Carnegiea gigantea TaxID=171969 RepID=A0A9Q1JZ11_9CARY|nr:LOW QUALITY PROTEIN: hypothetical protein Cgig2_019797 [Carnegiea gigantea]